MSRRSRFTQGCSTDRKEGRTISNFIKKFWNERDGTCVTLKRGSFWVVTLEGQLLSQYSPYTICSKAALELFFSLKHFAFSLKHFAFPPIGIILIFFTNQSLKSYLMWRVAKCNTVK